jgi:hypothetical protein
MQARRYVEQQREQAKDRRDSMQSFLHLHRWTFQSVKVMHSFLKTFLPASKTEGKKILHSVPFAVEKGVLWQR